MLSARCPSTTFAGIAPPAPILSNVRRITCPEGRTGSAHTISRQPEHVRAVLLQHVPVFEAFSQGVFENHQTYSTRVTDPNTANRHPFRGCRHFGWVIPKTLLSQVKSDRINQRNHEPEMVDRTCRHSFVPTASDIQDEAAVLSQDTANLFCKWQEPFDIAVLRDIAVFFLVVQSVRW